MRAVMLALLAIGLVCAACGDDPTPAEPGTGNVTVRVIDNSTGLPVPGAEITLVPSGATSTTDDDGVVQFQVQAGDYFVDARICCIGPGWLEYHEPVVVREGESMEVTLFACSACV